MKQLTCEMCGSTDLLKQDGVFVCQSCGCKYSVEEAKKMMIEGVVEVSGTVRIDHLSEIDNILKNADTTYHDGNYEEAFDLYSQALSIAPDNPHAVLFRALSSVWQSTIRDFRIREIISATKRAVNLQHSIYGDEKEYFDFCLSAILEIEPVINAMHSLCNNYYYGIKAHSGLSLTGAIIAYGVNASSKDELEERTKSCCLVNKSVVRCVLDGVESYDKISDELWAALDTIAHNTVVYIQNIGLSTYYGELEAKETVDYIADCKQKAVQSANEKQLVKNSTYWATHISEKEKLEAKKSDAESKRSELIAEMERAPEQEQIRNLQSQINDLTYKLNVLGMNPLDAFMNRKERNSLQAQINNLSEILRPIESAVSERNAKLQLQIDEQSTIIAEVDAELSKNR